MMTDPEQLLGPMKLIKIAVIAGLLFLVGCGNPLPPSITTTTTASGLQPQGVSGDFSLVFQDEFSGTELNDAWYPNRWFATNCAPGAGSNEDQIYTTRESNVSIAGGNLRLTAQRENYNCAEWGQSRPFTSGWVQTGGSRDVGGINKDPAFTCSVGCFVEASIKMPAGEVTFPAVWMLSTDGYNYPSRPEFDIIEFYETWDRWKQHLHLDCANPGFTYNGSDATDGYHTVGLWWQEDSIKWYVDGVETFSYNGCVPINKEMYVILNHAVGGAAPEPSEMEQFPKTMLIDYVRVWQNK